MSGGGARPLRRAPSGSPWRLLLLAGATAVVLGSGAERAAASPDAHDRALAATLSSRVAEFREIASAARGPSSSRLEGCPYLKKNPSQALAAVVAIVPVLLIETVDEFRPELTSLGATLGAMRPDAPVFAQWLADERDELALILQFDNHGRAIDLCDAVGVLLAKHPSAADIERVLGIKPTLIAMLFSTASQKSSAELSELAPRMAAFFLAAGLSKASAAELTSSN